MDTERIVSRVMSRIVAERRLAARRMIARNAIVAAGATVGFMLAARAMFYDAAQSGFSAYLSLFFSDARTVFAHWQNAAWVLAETLPTIRVLIMLGFMFAALRAARDIRHAHISAPEPRNK